MVRRLKIWGLGFGVKKNLAGTTSLFGALFLTLRDSAAAATFSLKADELFGVLGFGVWWGFGVWGMSPRLAVHFLYELSGSNIMRIFRK